MKRIYMSNYRFGKACGCLKINSEDSDFFKELGSSWRFAVEVEEDVGIASCWRVGRADVLRGLSAMFLKADLGLSNEPATAILAEAVDCCPSTKVFTGIGMVFVTGWMFTDLLVIGLFNFMGWPRKS